MNLLNDIYYSDEYIKLYLKDDESIYNFAYFENDNIFVNKSIKRPIKKIANFEINDGYYDLESAYGYGGFYTTSFDNKFLKNAFLAYENQCREENIVAEFIRFHPFNNFPKYGKKYFDFKLYDRDVAIVNLEQDILQSYKSKVRNIVKKALKNVTISKSENIDKFINLYYKTMEKNCAEKFYFFDKNYFNKLINMNNIELYEVKYQNEIVAMAFFMFGKDLVHYHLSANSNISYKINANYALLHYMFETAQKRDKKYFILGGGTTSNSDDPLLKFKKKFTNIFKPFYIAGKVYSKEKYDEYNKLWDKYSKNDIKYFLKYRLEI